MRARWHASVVVLAVYAAIASAGVVSLGPNWDDVLNTQRVEIYAAFVRSGDASGLDGLAQTNPSERYYGIAYDLPHAILHRLATKLTGTHDWVLTRRIYNACVGAILFGLVLALGRRMLGADGGWIPAAVLLGMPAFTGQVVMNQKDMPFALGAVAVVLATLSRGRWRYFASVTQARLVRDALV